MQGNATKARLKRDSTLYKPEPLRNAMTSSLLKSLGSNSRKATNFPSVSTVLQIKIFQSTRYARRVRCRCGSWK